MTSIKDIISVPSGKIRIIPASSKERELIHRWIATKHPKDCKAGLKSELFAAIDCRVYKQCYYCDYKNVSINNYHYGVLKNNLDEWRSGTCPRCGEYISHECYYDGGAIYVSGRNIMAFGDYFQHYQKHPGSDVSDEEINKILINKKIYKIDAPTIRLNRKKIGEYIDEHLKQILLNVDKHLNF